jgi:hypothetical protein
MRLIDTLISLIIRKLFMKVGKNIKLDCEGEHERNDDIRA